jgi:hypothetical protein
MQTGHRLNQHVDAQQQGCQNLILFVIMHCVCHPDNLL